MESDIERVCPHPPKPKKFMSHLKGYRTLLMVMSLTVILTSVSFMPLMTPSSPLVGSIRWEVPVQGDVFLLRMDENGTLLWNMSYGGPLNEWPNSVVEVSTGGFAILSGFGKHDNRTALITRIDTRGEVIWNRTYSDIYIHPRNFRNFFFELMDGGFAIFDGNILVTDDMGQLARTHLTNESPWGYPISIVECSSGGFAYAYEYGYMGSYTAIQRIDTSNNTLWYTEFICPNAYACHSNVVEDSNGGFVFWMGGAYGNRGDNGGNLTHIDSQGNRTWWRYIPPWNEYYQKGFDIIKCSEGGFLLYSIHGCRRVDNWGRTEWKKEIPSWKAIELTSGRFVLLEPNLVNGELWNTVGSFALSCLDSNGHHLWRQTLEMPSHQEFDLVACADGGFAVAVSAESSFHSIEINDIPSDR
ncbi:MAG: hypothetical protein ACFFAX_16965, partial [Promethearchaeota archaeon]